MTASTRTLLVLAATGTFLAGCGEVPSSSAVALPPTAEPAASQPVLVDCLNGISVRLAEDLMKQVPSDLRIAVLPLVDSDGGVRRIGVLLSEGIERTLVEHGRPVVDRIHLNALLDEIDLQQALAANLSAARAASTIAKVDVLLVGRTVDAGDEMLCAVRALQVSTSHVLAQTAEVSLPRGQLGRLLWYVRRPTSQTAAGELPPLALRCEFITQAPGGEMRLGDGSTVRSGQKFRIRVQPNSDCYLYVLLYDSQGRASVLFPHKKIGLPNDIRGGVSYEIPEGSKWYWFDDQPGTETFYLVASYTRLNDLDRLLVKMQQDGNRHVQIAAAAREQIDKVIIKGMSANTSADYQPKGMVIKIRGVGGVTDIGWGTAAAGSSAETDNVVSGHATVVKKIVLNHR